MENNTNEMKLADVRIRLADVVHAATVRGQITYLTNRGRRVAAIVPLAIAEQHDDAQPAHDEHS